MLENFHRDLTSDMWFAESSSAADTKIDSLLDDRSLSKTTSASKTTAQALDAGASGGFSYPAAGFGETISKRDDFDSDSDEAASETSAPSRLQFKVPLPLSESAAQQH